MQLQETISLLVQLTVVPVVMLAMLWYAASFISDDAEPDRKVSARAGFWAGLVLFIAYLVIQLNAVKEFSFDVNKVNILPQFYRGPMVTGLIIGFLFLWLVRFLAPTRMVGLITLTLSSTSLAALYSYFFIESLSAAMLSVALGLALGALVHVVFFPRSVRGK